MPDAVMASTDLIHGSGIFFPEDVELPAARAT
jgi:hypothetical protein